MIDDRSHDRRVHQQGIVLDENRISGTARNAGGKIEEGAGNLVGNAKTQIQGKLDQASGAAQDLYGQAADAARETATGFDKWLRTTIETQHQNTSHRSERFYTDSGQSFPHTFHR